jgi:hypothetical protein
MRILLIVINDTGRVLKVAIMYSRLHMVRRRFAIRDWMVDTNGCRIRNLWCKDGSQILVGNFGNLLL